MSRLDVLITGPSLQDQGGVANYYNAVLPFLKADDQFAIDYFEIGSTRGASGPLHPIADQVRFYKAVRKTRPDLVHVNPSLNLKSLVRDGLIIYQARRLGIPVLVFFRGWDSAMEVKIDRHLGWFFRMTYAKANGFVVLAKRIREKLLEWNITTPISLETTTVQDRSLQGFSIADKTDAIGKAKLTKILFMSRLEEAKGIFETLDAVVRLLQSGIAVSLTVAGDGVAMADVRKFVADNEIFSGMIHVVGYVDGEAKRAMLEEHHIYCLPSDTEGMPNSVLEAMAFGMPVITCPVGGLADFFEDGRMGFLMERRDTNLIAEKLQLLVNDRDAMIGMASYNHQYAVSHFLASEVAGRLGSYYSNMVGR